LSNPDTSKVPENAAISDEEEEEVMPRPRLWKKPTGSVFPKAHVSSHRSMSASSEQQAASEQIMEKLAAMTGESVRSRAPISSSLQPLAPSLTRGIMPLPFYSNSWAERAMPLPNFPPLSCEKAVQ